MVLTSSLAPQRLLGRLITVITFFVIFHYLANFFSQMKCTPPNLSIIDECAETWTVLDKVFSPPQVGGA